MTSPLRSKLRAACLAGQRLLGVRPTRFAMITGCPRSGTSALSSWLGKQPTVESVYESRITVAAYRFYQEVERFQKLTERAADLHQSLRENVFRFYASQNVVWRRLVVDKEPLEPIAFPEGNYAQYVRFLLDVFPYIRIVFVEREPVHTVWSMLARTWGKSLADAKKVTWSLEDCCQIWRENHELALAYVGHPQVTLCRYEELVQSPQQESQRISDFLQIRLGRPFQPREGAKLGFSEQEIALIRELTGSRVALS